MGLPSIGQLEGLVQWLYNNPDHLDREEISEYPKTSQDDYFGHQRKYVGLVVMVLIPID